MNEVTPIHQWTNGGDEVLVVRFVNKDGTSSAKRRDVNHGTIDAEPFKHPLTVGEIVVAPDWVPDFACGGGIHGWPWGMSLGEGKECDWSATWLVYGVKTEDICGGQGDLIGKCKFRTGIVRHVGTWDSATNFVLSGQMAWVDHAARGAASATGDRGVASATGESGAASATGWRGAASATGACSAAVVTNLNGRAKSGEFGCIALAFWNADKQRSEMRCARTGTEEGMLKPDTWYTLDLQGNFAEEIDK